MTTFGSATITLLRDDDGNNAQWLQQPRLDERDLLGVAETDINLLGFGSAELNCRVLCLTQSDYNLFLAMNGRESSLDTGDGEGSRSCVLTISSVKAMAGHRYLMQCRFKETS